MGELHLDIIQSRMDLEFGVKSNAGKPQTSYRETITKSANGVGKLIVDKEVAGKGQYAHVELKMTPNKRGEGVTVENKLDDGDIPKVYQDAVLRGVDQAVINGTLMSYPVIDIHVELVGGSSHETDSNDHAFEMATVKAMHDAFNNGASTLLEPMMTVAVETPEENQGDIIGDLNRRRGKINDIETQVGISRITSEVPIANMIGYVTDIRTLSKGRATFSMEPK